MDFRSGSPSDNSGAEEMEVSLAKPKHRVVRPVPCLWGVWRTRGPSRRGQENPHTTLGPPAPA